MLRQDAVAGRCPAARVAPLLASLQLRFTVSLEAVAVTARRAHHPPASRVRASAAAMGLDPAFLSGGTRVALPPLSECVGAVDQRRPRCSPLELPAALSWVSGAIGARGQQRNERGQRQYAGCKPDVNLLVVGQVRSRRPQPGRLRVEVLRLFLARHAGSTRPETAPRGYFAVAAPERLRSLRVLAAERRAPLAVRSSSERLAAAVAGVHRCARTTATSRPMVATTRPSSRGLNPGSGRGRRAEP